MNDASNLYESTKIAVFEFVEKIAKKEAASPAELDAMARLAISIFFN